MRVPKTTFDKARALRRQMTPPEAALWMRLRKRRNGFPAFRRQHPFGPYVLDFYCAPLRLAIEVDGLVHGTADHPGRDARRDAWLAAQGIEVIRIPASDVLKDADEVAQGLWVLLEARHALGGLQTVAQPD